MNALAHGESDHRDTWLGRFVHFFAARSALTVVLWAGLLIFGALAYFSFLPREGFPAVDAPLALVRGTYFVDDAERVDAEVVQPLAAKLIADPSITDTTTTAQKNSFTLITDLASGTASADGARIIEEQIAGAGLPADAEIFVQPLSVALFLNEYNLLIGVYGPPDATADELEAAAALALPAFGADARIESAEVVDLVQRGLNPATGEEVAQESFFNQITPTDDASSLRPSIAIGLVAADGVDSLGIREAADGAITTANTLVPAEFTTVVAIDLATQIRRQINSLQQNVLTGIIAVAFVALLLISWRASIITAVFIATVMATTFGVLYLIGISLNTVSLFGVIIALGLFVDDSIVITEAIDAFREESLSPLAVIRRAIQRVGAASVSGTLTTVLVFAPMLAISGILGSFIRILPISVIVALIVSLLLSLMFIPLASRFLILSRPRSTGLLGGIEERCAHLLARIVGIRGRAGIAVGAAGIGLSLIMTAVGLFVFAPRVGFNIFPPQKDSEAVSVEFAFPPDTSIDDARLIATDVNQAVLDQLGDDVRQGYTYLGGSRQAFTQFRLSPMGSRDKAPDLVDNILKPIAEQEGRARVAVSVVSNGPPELLFPFQLQVFDENPAEALAAAELIRSRIEAEPIPRPNGTTFSVVESEIALTDTVSRINGRRYVELRARFDADDVTTTTAETRTFVQTEFGSETLAALGLETDALGFDFGLESDNQESFNSMPRAFMLALVLMLILLVVQFRSTVQWILVFLAIPFSFFGVFGGLLLTNNQISFFVMLGLLGLIGIAVNNTILLTDFANQERAAGAGRKDAIATAMQRRFRPLVATSLTTVAGVLPLALSDPFWEALGFTLIFGLLSSTFLVLVSFPFYYLAFEWIRSGVRTPWRRKARSPLVATGS